MQPARKKLLTLLDRTLIGLMLLVVMVLLGMRMMNPS